MSTSDAVPQTLSKESRAALRSALKEQLAAVKKKVRHMRAKNLLGVKDDGERREDTGKTQSKGGGRENADTNVANRETDRGSDQSRGKDRGDDHAEKQEGQGNRGEVRGEGEGEGPSAELRAEAEQFFSKGNTSFKPGKTKSVFARILTSEQREFSKANKAPSASKKQPPSGKGKGGGRG